MNKLFVIAGLLYYCKCNLYKVSIQYSSHKQLEKSS